MAAHSDPFIKVVVLTAWGYFPGRREIRAESGAFIMWTDITPSAETYKYGPARTVAKRKQYAKNSKNEGILVKARFF